MNGQFFGEHFNSSDKHEETEKDPTSPVEDADQTLDKPMGEGNVDVGSLNEPTIPEKPMNESEGAVDPLNEPIPYKAPAYEPMPYKSSAYEPILYKAPEEESIAPATPPSTIVAPAPTQATNVASATTLLNHDESEHFRMRWNEIQGKFVDEPRAAVQQADALVSEVIEHITQKFASEHGLLEDQWKQGSDVSTEDLRKALQHYRSFFNRLVV